MVTHDGLLTTYNIARFVINAGISGDFVETGCCQGGSSAMMAYAALHKMKIENCTYLTLLLDCLNHLNLNMKNGWIGTGKFLK